MIALFMHTFLMTYSTLILVNSYSCVYWLFICMCTCFWRNVYFILLYILKLCYHLNIELTVKKYFGSKSLIKIHFQVLLFCVHFFILLIYCVYRCVHARSCMGVHIHVQIREQLSGAGSLSPCELQG